MKNITTAIAMIAASLFSYNSKAQNSLMKLWDFRFGGKTDESLIAARQTSDGGYILGGYSNSIIGGDKTQTVWGGFGDYDYWIIKLDSIGNKQWDKDFGGTANDYFTCLAQTSDGGYIFGGYTGSGINGNKTQANWDTTGIFSDYWIVKTDSLGNIQWDKDFGGINGDALYSIQQTRDGGYILGGSSASGIGGNKTQACWGQTDYWIVKIDSNGIFQWDRDFGGFAGDDLCSIQQTTDGGYILGGISESGIGGDKTQLLWGGLWYPDYWIIKTDSLGIKVWDKDFGGNYIDVFSCLQQTTDGGYILGGTSSSQIGGDKTQNTCGDTTDADYWIIKIDSQGNKQWDKDYGGSNSDYFYSLQQTTDGGYLLGGYSYSNISCDKAENNLSYVQTWVMKTDSIGNKQWDKTLHTNAAAAHRDEAGIAIESNDGCYVMANYTAGSIGGDKTQSNLDTTNATHDYWIIKFCDSTQYTGINEPTTENTLTLSPNPVSTNLRISSNKPITQIKIFSTLGALQSEISKPKSEIDISALSSGIYFINIQTPTGSFVKKFIKE